MEKSAQFKVKLIKLLGTRGFFLRKHIEQRVIWRTGSEVRGWVASALGARRTHQAFAAAAAGACLRPRRVVHTSSATYWAPPSTNQRRSPAFDLKVHPLLQLLSRSQI
jgi:hypothetical protein